MSEMRNIITLNKSEILFNSGPPSNFYETDGFTVEAPRGVTIGQPSPYWLMVRSTERYFQAMKAYYAKKESDQRFWDIIHAPDNRQAKAMGRNVRFSPSELAIWDGTWALEVMLRANIAKFSQVDECREWLINTGDARLIEHRPDPLWGDGMNGSGRNLLGHVLEVVRARIT
jgi:N-glycosidase YbiA